MRTLDSEPAGEMEQRTTAASTQMRFAIRTWAFVDDGCSRAFATDEEHWRAVTK